MTTNVSAAGTGGSGGGKLPRQKPAGLAVYKRELRKAIARNRVEPEINFLNITAMMDMMTIILVFLLKSLSTSTASLPQSQDLQLPKSVLTTEPDSEPEGLAVIVSKSQIIAGETVVCPVPPDAAQYGTEAKYKRGSRRCTMGRAQSPCECACPNRAMPEASYREAR